MDAQKTAVKSILLISIALIVISNGCKPHVEIAQKKFFRMDTITEISLVVNNKKEADRCWNSIDSLLVDWENRFSIEGQLSEVRQINNRKDSVLLIGFKLKEIITTAIRYGDTLGGDFDVTVYPLKQLWGFAETSKPDSTIPVHDQIQSALKKVDYRQIKIVGDSVLFLSAQTRVDVGGIAKGFVLREIGSMLKTCGINSFLVSAGGDIIISGKRINGKPWRVGIQHPRNDGIIGAVEIDSGSIVTSGDYERFRIVNGKRYHHLFDIRTGYPVSKNQSVTILGPDPVEADIMSTGLFSRNAEEIVKFINERPNFECLVIDSSGTVFTSERWKDKVEIVK